MPIQSFSQSDFIGKGEKMDLLEFVQRHVKTKVDFDGAYGAQCVDLFRQYCKDVLGVPRTESVKGAKDLAERYRENPIEKGAFCLITDSRSCKAGDVAVWGATKANPYGHVAIVLAVRPGGSLAVFEQDGFAQDGARLAWRDGNSAIGFLRAWEAV